MRAFPLWQDDFIHTLEAHHDKLLFALGLGVATQLALFAPLAQAQPCPEKSVLYWQAFAPGGESDLSARYQQIVLKKKCAAIDTGLCSITNPR